MSERINSFLDIAKKMMNDENFNSTYSLRECLKIINMCELKYTLKSSDVLFYYDGCNIELKNGYLLSLQANPQICGSALCETCLIKNNKVVYSSSIGYEDANRFDTPEELKNHLLSIKDKDIEETKYCIPN